ncbi:hypothetical protein SCHPADRAFT_897066 [Schizopora paradoxa]|uniref:Uncharacterized protein n=1 Tax=Schizopora paradoxa TaxID=27342 RepID=A0A0H2R4I4_9AGAM|nr:hypothetical protein SCHPADRAFT_897066 [Schizopora paradoxa]
MSNDGFPKCGTSFADICSVDRLYGGKLMQEFSTTAGSISIDLRAYASTFELRIQFLKKNGGAYPNDKMELTPTEKWTVHFDPVTELVIIIAEDYKYVFRFSDKTSARLFCAHVKLATSFYDLDHDMVMQDL